MFKPRSRRTGPSRQDVWSQKTKIAQEMVCRASRTSYLCLPFVSDEFSTIIQWNYQFLIEHKTYTSAKSSRVLYKTEVDTMYFWTSIIKLVKKKMYKEAFVRLTSISVALQLVETSKDQAAFSLKSKLPHSLFYFKDRLNHITWL